MDPFAVFDTFNQQNTKEQKIIKNKNDCQHLRFTIENSTHTCEDCGEEIKEFLDIECPPDRHQETLLASIATKPRIRTIQDKLLEMGFPAAIREKAEGIYSMLTDGDIRRGEIRDSLILASVFESYQQLGDNSITMKYLRNKFALKRNRAHPGRKLVMTKAKKDRNNGLNDNNALNRSSYTSPISLIPDILSKWETDTKCYDDIKKIYDKIEDKSNLIDRSRPNSVAAGLVYYYMLLTRRKNCNLAEFSKKVKLSESTIKKISTEISNILRTPHVIQY